MDLFFQIFYVTSVYRCRKEGVKIAPYIQSTMLYVRFNTFIIFGLLVVPVFLLESCFIKHRIIWQENKSIIKERPKWQNCKWSRPALIEVIHVHDPVKHSFIWGLYAALHGITQVCEIERSVLTVDWKYLLMFLN
jgi:hypothetical protein